MEIRKQKSVAFRGDWKWNKTNQTTSFDLLICHYCYFAYDDWEKFTGGIQTD